MHQKRGRRSLINSRVLIDRPPRACAAGASMRGCTRCRAVRPRSCQSSRHRLPAHTSAQMVGSALGSRSRLITSQPSSAKALPTDPVPENNSSNRGILVFHVGLEEPDHRNEGGAAAGQLQVAQRALPEALPLRDILIEEPRVAAPGGTRHVGRTSLFWKHQEKRGPDRATMELILGEVQTNARGGKFLPLKGNPVWRSTEPAAVMWEPSAYKDAAGDRVNVCLEATEEALAAVAGWEAKMAAKTGARHVRQAPD